MEQRQTAPAQDTERAVVDLETFERVWRRVMPNQDMSPIQVGAPTGPGTGAERQAERIPAPAQLQNQDQGADGSEPVETAGSEAGCLRLGFRGGLFGYLGGVGRGGCAFFLNGGKGGGIRFRRGRRCGFRFRG